MPEPKKKLCPDPECGKESPEESEDCVGCGINFAAFGDLDKLMGARQRRDDAAKPKPEKKATLAQRLASASGRKDKK
jgi:hypothetical protein